MGREKSRKVFQNQNVALYYVATFLSSNKQTGMLVRAVKDSFLLHLMTCEILGFRSYSCGLRRGRSLRLSHAGLLHLNPRTMVVIFQEDVETLRGRSLPKEVGVHW